MAIEASRIVPDRKNLVQRIGVDTKQLVDKIVPKSGLDLPRDPKGYTWLYDPQTKQYELVLAIIPMPGDPDYRQSGPEIKLIDMTSALQIEAMELQRHRRLYS